MISKIFQYIAIAAAGLSMCGVMSPAEAKTVRVQVDDGSKAAAKKTTQKKAAAKRKAPSWIKYKHISSTTIKGSPYVVRVVIRFTNDSADKRITAIYDKSFKLKLISNKSGASIPVVFSEKIWDEITLKPGETVDIRYGVKLSADAFQKWINKYKNEGFKVNVSSVDCQVKHNTL